MKGSQSMGMNFQETSSKKKKKEEGRKKMELKKGSDKKSRT